MGGSRDGGELLRLLTGNPRRKQQWITAVRPRLHRDPDLPPPSLCGRSSTLWPGRKEAPACPICGEGPSTTNHPPIPPTPQIHTVSMRPPAVSPLLSLELPQYPSSPLPADTGAACALVYFPRKGGEPLPSRGHPSFSSESWQRGQAPVKT